MTAQTTRKNTAHVAFDLDKGTKGQGVYRTSPTFAADFTVTLPDGPTRLIVLDEVIYLQRQAQPWVRNPAGSTGVADAMTAQADIGRRTTRYAIDVDVATLAGVERESVVQTGLRDLTKQRVTRIPYRLWLDDENLPVKIVVALPGQTSTARYTNWASRST